MKLQNDEGTWELLGVISRFDFMPKRLTDALSKRGLSAKFYFLAYGNGTVAIPNNTVYTIQYVRDWMWLYNQLITAKERGEPSRDPLGNLGSLNQKYQIKSNHLLYPDRFSWVEITGLEFDGLEPVSSKMDTFQYTGATIKPIRLIPLDLDPRQAELLH